MNETPAIRPTSSGKTAQSSWQQTARWAWGHFCTFLEIIGLRDERKDVDHVAQLSRFKQGIRVTQNFIELARVGVHGKNLARAQFGGRDR